MLIELGGPAQCAAGHSGCAPCRLRRHGHSASIPPAFAPAALRALLASRGSAQLGTPQIPPNRPRRIGQASAPPPWSGRGGYAVACCGRLCGCVSSSTLAVLVHRITKDGSRTQRPTSLWNYHATSPCRRRRVRRGRSHLSLECRPGRHQGASRYGLRAGIPRWP